jgi:alkylhydroperoxidase family enzyme
MADSRFALTELDELPDDLRERVGEIASKSGFVPNIFRALGHRPAELRAFLDYHDALMERTEGLSKAERELVGDADIAAARSAGLTHDEIWDVGSITALFAASNRLAHLTALEPNAEFYLMGRVPRAGH